MILNIEEMIKDLNINDSQQNLNHIKQRIRKCWERGEDPNIGQISAEIPLRNEHRQSLCDWFQFYADFGFIQRELIPSLQEMVFHHHQSLSLLTHQRVFKEVTDINSEDFQQSLELMARRQGQNFTYQNPFVSFTFILQDQEVRVSLMHRSLSPFDSHKAFIRFLKKESFPLEHFGHQAQKIIPMIVKKSNLLIVGATGSGKTTLTRTLMEHFPSTEHIITLEDTFELRKSSSNFTALLSRPEVSLDQLLAHALRMTPDRIVVGEIRSMEVVTALLAMNTGHKGFLSTLHANNCLDAIHRLALLFSLYAPNQNIAYTDIIKMIVASVDAVIFLENKKVHEIILPLSAEGRDVYFEKIL